MPDFIKSLKLTVETIAGRTREYKVAFTSRNEPVNMPDVPMRYIFEIDPLMTAPKSFKQEFLDEEEKNARDSKH